MHFVIYHTFHLNSEKYIKKIVFSCLYTCVPQNYGGLVVHLHTYIIQKVVFIFYAP